MESMLVVIMAGALAAAVILGGLVVKLTLDERRRAAARVAFLAGLASEAAGSAVPRESTADLELRYADVADFEPEPEQRRRAKCATSRHDRGRRARSGATAASMTAPSSNRPSSSRRPSSGRRGRGVQPSAQRTGGERFSASRSAAARPATSAAQRRGGESDERSSLDLMSLKHAQDTDAMTIVGLVHNPVNGPTLPNVFAHGSSLRRRRLVSRERPGAARLRRSQPERRNGFVIKVPVSAAVARYRIGFRAEDGRVDRPCQSALGQRHRKRTIMTRLTVGVVAALVALAVVAPAGQQQSQQRSRSRTRSSASRPASS